MMRSESQLGESLLCFMPQQRHLMHRNHKREPLTLNHPRVHRHPLIYSLWRLGFVILMRMQCDICIRLDLLTARKVQRN